MFKNRLLWKIFKTKWEAVTEGWEELHNEDLYELHFFSIILSQSDLFYLYNVDIEVVVENVSVIK